MKYLLDTNICIYLIKQKPAGIIDRFQTLTPGDVGVSAITVAELQYGAAKSAFPDRNRLALAGFLAPLEILDFNASDAEAYGRIRVELERAGMPIGAYDMPESVKTELSQAKRCRKLSRFCLDVQGGHGFRLLIAAQALAGGLVLVTNNEREFIRIVGLRVENWCST